MANSKLDEMIRNSKLTKLIKSNAAILLRLAGVDTTLESKAGTSQLEAITNQVTAVEADIAAIDNGGGLVKSYVHSGNPEFVITSVNVDTDTFTFVGAAPANGDLIVPTLNQDAGNVYPITVFTGGIITTKYYAVNRTDTTCQVSLTLGGSAVDITTNATMDLSKWHFEKYAATVAISDLPPAKKYRIIIQGRQPNPSSGSANNNFLVNGVACDDSGKAIRETGTTYGFGDNAFLANVYLNLEVVIDFTDILTMSIKGFTTNCTAAGAFATTPVNKVRSTPTKRNQDIVSFALGNWIVVNGLTIQVFDMALAKQYNTGIEIEKVLNHADFYKPFYASPNALTVAPCVTFIDDDGKATALSILYPIFNAKNVPCVVAACRPDVVPEGGTALTVAELLALETAGWEIACHGYNHISHLLGTDDQIIDEIREGKKLLEGYGLTIDNFVYPYNATTDFSRNLVSKYFDCAATGGEIANKQPVNNYRLARCPLGAFYVNATHNTYDFYKSMVDYAIANNGWLIFMMHSWSTDFDATQQQALSDIIDYCIANSVSIVTMRDGYKRFGNMFEIDNIFKITNQGVMHPGPRYFTSADVTIGTLAAGASTVVTLAAGFTVTNRPVIANIPGLATEIMVSAQASGMNVYVRFLNTHSGALDLGTKDINICVL